MDFLQTVKMLCQNEEGMRINFHVNSIPWRHRHIHDYWEVQVMLLGEVENQINQHSHFLKKCEVQILRPNDVHYMKLARNQNYECLNLEIKKDIFSKICEVFYPQILNELFIFKECVPAFILPDSSLLKIRDLLVFAQQKVDILDPDRQFLIMEILMECLFAFINQNFVHNTIQEYSFSETLIKMMKKSENIGLKLNEVCKKFPCQVMYAIRKFKEEGRETPNKVFRKIKLDYACGLLRTTQYSLEIVADIIGFHNTGYFCRIFEEEIGMKATEYRTKYYRK